MREGASEQSSDLKNYTAPGPRPPVLKFLDPPLIGANTIAQLENMTRYKESQI